MMREAAAVVTVAAGAAADAEAADAEAAVAEAGHCQSFGVRPQHPCRHRHPIGGGAPRRCREAGSARIGQPARPPRKSLTPLLPPRGPPRWRASTRSGRAAPSSRSAGVARAGSSATSGATSSEGGGRRRRRRRRRRPYSRRSSLRARGRGCCCCRPSSRSRRSRIHPATWTRRRSARVRAAGRTACRVA